jgi:hypothetical protein
MMQTVYKLVKDEGGVRTSCVAMGKWLVTYPVGQRIVTPHPMFAFKRPEVAAEFVADNFDDAEYELWECTAEEVEDVPRVVPYGDLIDQEAWHLFWNEHDMWRLVVTRKNYGIGRFHAALVNGLTLVRDVSKEYLP